MTIYAVESEVNFVCESFFGNIKINVYTAIVDGKIHSNQQANIHYAVFDILQ
jgi:hypothetical protein